MLGSEHVTRIVLLLQSFSAVVGPNGSGKSNVIDAMLFVFGRRAKQVRSGTGTSCLTIACLDRARGRPMHMPNAEQGHARPHACMHVCAGWARGPVGKLRPHRWLCLRSCASTRCRS